MGYLDNGEWVDEWYDTKRTGGKFVRSDSQCRNWITADGSAGPSGEGGFTAESGRYHLYVAHACPWAHRAMIFRALKGLEDHISHSVVHWRMHENGWSFEADPDVIADSVNGADYMWQVYIASDPSFSGRVTVPVLWDKKTNKILSNESSEIIRMFNSAFDGLDGVDSDLNFYPDHLHDEIETVNDRIYHTLNNGVYKSGFATTQEAYTEAVTTLFDTMDWLEDILSKQRYLAGDQLTEADWRLFTTLLRFDPVYFGHFKCNIRRLIDYPNLWNYTLELYQVPGIAETINLGHIKSHYYGSHRTVNPTLIVPEGPDIDFTVHHDREKFPAAA
jgi:putative glutathione S-transferase